MAYKKGYFFQPLYLLRICLNLIAVFFWSCCFCCWQWQTFHFSRSTNSLSYSQELNQ